MNNLYLLSDYKYNLSLRFITYPRHKHYIQQKKLTIKIDYQLFTVSEMRLELTRA